MKDSQPSKLIRISLTTCEEICKMHRLRLIHSNTPFISAKLICAWCKHEIYIGCKFIQVPEDIDAYFLSTSDWEIYNHVVSRG